MINKLEKIIYETPLFGKIKNEIIKQEFTNVYLVESADDIYLRTFMMMFATLFLSDNINNFEQFSTEIAKIENHPNINIFGFQDEKINMDLVDNILDVTILSSYLSNKKKIILVNDISTFDIRYQNKLLKTLEESNSNNIFILGAKNSTLVIDTVKSRCKKIQLPKLANETVLPLFDGYQENRFDFAYQFFSGNISTMYNIIEDDEYFNIYNIVKETMLGMRNSRQILEYYERVNEFISRKGNLEKSRMYLSKLMDMYSVYIKYLIEFDASNEDGEAEEILKFYNKISLAYIIYNIIEVNTKNKFNINPNELYKMFLFKMLEVRYQCQK